MPALRRTKALVAKVKERAPTIRVKVAVPAAAAASPAATPSAKMLSTRVKPGRRVKPAPKIEPAAVAAARAAQLLAKAL